MPDPYATDCAEVQAAPEDAPVITDPETLQPDTKLSERESFHELISQIDDLVSEQPVSKTAEGIADISPSNVIVIDTEESVAPLRKTFRTLATLKSDIARDETEIMAEKCHDQLYTSEEWTATEELFYEIEHLTTLTASSQNNVSGFASPGSSTADTVAVKEKQFADFVAAIENSHAIGCRNASEEADTLINAVYGYQQVFNHLIKNVVAPGNERFYKLLKDFMYLRSAEGEIVLETERITRKLMQLHEEQGTSGSTFKQKQSHLSSSFQKVDGRFKRFQRELCRLKTEFAKEIPSILEFISKIGSARAQASNAWNSLYNMSDSADLFDTFDVLNLIHKQEFENMTSWHATAGTGEISHLLVKDFAILVDCNTMLSTMFSLLRTTFDTRER